MTVTSIRDAWAEVQKIFPTDYEHDTSRSERAGYPIYSSTAAGVNAWMLSKADPSMPRQNIEIWVENGQNGKNRQKKSLFAILPRKCGGIDYKISVAIGGAVWYTVAGKHWQTRLGVRTDEYKYP